jgi:nucleotide-binding universal stress UspA family protein
MDETRVNASTESAEATLATPFRRIAVCLDGSELGERIIPHALAVAQSFGTPVTFLRVLEGRPVGDVPPDPLEWDIRRREARDYLAQLADECRSAGAAIDVELIDGHAAEQIILWTEHHEADLTVLCSHGARGRTGWSLASTAQKLVEGAPGSLLLVPAAAAAVSGVARYRRILVPLDGSSRAESVIPLATRLAASHGAEMILAHIVPIPELTEIGLLDAEDIELRDRLVQRNERVAHEYLDRLHARGTAKGVSLRVIALRGGDVRNRLASLISDEAVDLVVLSAHGHGGRCDAPCGSVATYLLGRAAAPLLVVRPRTARAIRRAHAAPEATGGRLPSQAGS